MSRDFTELIDLASERIGGIVLSANDEFFAPKENLIEATSPVFVAGKFTDHGKWMDGWETRRRRDTGFDWCIVELGAPGIIRGVRVDTTHFKGNHPESCSIEACAAPDGWEPTVDSPEWVEILAETPLAADTANDFTIASPFRFTHVKLNIHPDGGVARLRVFGEPVPRWQDGAVDLASAALGGEAVACSDQFFCHPDNLILPTSARNMGEGWETRRRSPGPDDWVVVRLAAPGMVRRVIVDTAHFKGNAPASCSLEGCSFKGDVPGEAAPWVVILPNTPLTPDSEHVFEETLKGSPAVTHVRFHIYPDGGVARLRVIGELASEERSRQGLRWLNTLPPARASEQFARCCASTTFAEAMVGRRPFYDIETLLGASDEVWALTEPADWLQAFAGHPRIGEKANSKWSSDEQAGANEASAKTRTALVEANKKYEEKFEHVFLICATGRSADEMLGALKERLDNKPADELRIAAEEQRKITRLRLEKLIS